MKKIWSSFSSGGLQFAKTVHDRKTILLINRMSVILTAMMLLFSLLAQILGLWDILLFSIPFGIIFSIIPLLQRNGWILFSKYLFTFSPVLCIFFVCIHNGAQMGDRFFLLTTAMIPLIIFRKKLVMFLLFLFSAFAFLVVEWYQSTHEPLKKLPNELEKQYWYFTVISVFALLYFVIRYFRSDNEDYEKELELKNDLIEEKNKDILSSIHYAKRIQRALLASDTLLQNNLPEYFILYKPKDIVSGDFYWADEIPDGKFILMTGDCTGHGVPGAFMSLLNISIMHEVVIGMNTTRPDKILNIQREAIIMSLNPPGVAERSKDGMDCVVCNFDFKNMKLEFACANNPLWILRVGDMLTFKADKQPIGIHEGDKKDFTLHSFDLRTGDIVYTFTDGFADQFGGPKGKKFKYSQLKETFLSIGNKNLNSQKDILEKTFEEWKGNLEQVDDVLVIGVKIK
ncbi:MAG: SpoIIE family protein phosphatase [Bacteroidetes bacterium]|nr:SpoIIE family protein phosphatase [Bacteroidota bacterium]